MTDPRPAADEAPAAPRPPRLPGPPDLLRWLYLGRITLVTGIMAGALLTGQATPLVSVLFLLGLGVSALSFGHTHVRGREPSQNFLYAQVILDVGLVTGIVHVTGGPESSFAPVYILVISAGALLLPLPGGVLIGALASIVYSADLAWAYPGSFDLGVALQIGLFTLVALVTGVLGDRLRRAGMALGEVESELRQLRLDTSDILANLSTGVLTVDGGGRLAYINPAAESLLGLSGRRWLGRPVMDELGRAAPGLGRILGRAIAEGRPVDRFRTVANVEGREVSLGISTAVLDRGDGVPPSATAIFQDITELERLDALRRRTDRLMALAELSASLAHEIKNPLASIRSAVEQLAGSRLGEDDRQLLERLILNESDRLSRLLTDFLEYSGMELGPREAVDLATTLRECVTVVRQHPAAEEVDVTCHGLDTPLPVPGDPDLLHRAFFNLLLNAVQFAGPGGRVRVALEDHRDGGDPRGAPVRRPVSVTVADSGPGVPEEAVDRLFNPFFTTREGGTGLGLAVVHRAVEAHEGAVFVERAEEGGARFVIYLPGSEVPEGAHA